MRTMVDPPSGWKYGFPKEIPSHIVETGEDITEWLLNNGYPQREVDAGMLKYCRFWEEED